MNKRMAVVFVAALLGACGSTPAEPWGTISGLPSGGGRRSTMNGTATDSGTTAGPHSTGTGTARDAGGIVPPGPQPTEPVCSVAFTDAYRFYWSGGMRMYYDTVDLMAPDRVRVTRRDYQGNSPTSCEVELACSCAGCVWGHGVVEVLGALSHSDVRAALAAGATRVGYDSRPADGAVFVLEQGAGQLEVGDPCPQRATGCTAVPQGLQRMVKVLDETYQEVLARADCATALR